MLLNQGLHGVIVEHFHCACYHAEHCMASLLSISSTAALLSIATVALRAGMRGAAL
jgi:hypothetical protein